MLNPFDLRGPEFLVFYVILGLAVTAAIAMLRHHPESAVDATLPLTDYLKIAYLRGGPDEALRIATVALVDRGLVEVIGDDHLKATPDRMPAGLQRTEERLLQSCRDPTHASEILQDTSLKITVTSECETALVRAGLLPDQEVKAARRSFLALGWCVLVLVALGKIWIALARGRTNVFFLIVAACLFVLLLHRIANPFRTRAGEAMLADLRRLFAGLRDRAASITSGSSTSEAALLAAVFGMGALPAGLGHMTPKIFRKLKDESSTSSWSSCGSGSSCGGGGGSCGGGGGGCGGCGG